MRESRCESPVPLSTKALSPPSRFCTVILFFQPAPKYHTKGCSRSFADSPGARTLVFAVFEPFHSCEFRASIARTLFCAILCRSPIFCTFVPVLSGTKKRVFLAKGVSVAYSVTAKETKNSQGYWPQQYIWHSERHSQERRTFFKNPLLKPPFPWLLILPFATKTLPTRKKIFSNYFPITVSRFRFLRINFRKLPDTYCICVSCVALPGWDPCPCRIFFYYRYPI